jgi:hypothetical protein
MKAIDQLLVRLLVLSLLYTFCSGICKGKEISLLHFYIHSVQVSAKEKTQRLEWIFGFL